MRTKGRERLVRREVERWWDVQRTGIAIPTIAVNRSGLDLPAS